MSNTINSYGDRLIQAGEGHGADIASQRADDLDLQAVAKVQELTLGGRLARALDLGAGRGAQAARLITAGATRAVAVDVANFSDEFLRQISDDKRTRALFIQADLLLDNFAENIRNQSSQTAFDVIMCQRTIHYFTWQSASSFLNQISQLLSPGGRLYISASGLGSELGLDYEDAAAPPESRFCCLAPNMATKHGILAPVCLYTRDDLIRQCLATGLKVISAQESAFGNIKVVAEKK